MENKKLSFGDVMKYTIIFLIVVGFITGILLAIFYDSTPKEEFIPQCSDGIDNDGDGLIDYPDDLNCKSPLDNYEGSYSGLFWFIGILVVLIIIIVIIMKKTKKQEPEEIGVLKEALPTQRAWELALSSLLKYKFKDIDAWIDKEKDGYCRYVPVEDNSILLIDTFWHVDKMSEESFQVCFIKVCKGMWAGLHCIMYPLMKGENAIKSGVPRFETGAWIGNWTRKSQTFRLGSLHNEKVRLELLKLEAGQNGDYETQQEAKAVLSTLGSSQSSAFVDEDDEERRERIRLENQNNQNKKKKKTTNTNNNQPDINLGSGDDKDE